MTGVRVAFFNKHGKMFSPNEEYRKQLDYNLKLMKDYPINQLQREGQVDLDMENQGDIACLNAILKCDTVELWDGSYNVINREFRLISPNALWVTVEKLD